MKTEQIMKRIKFIIALDPDVKIPERIRKNLRDVIMKRSCVRIGLIILRTL